MDVEPKIGGITPKWMVYFMENPIKMDDLGVPLFLETPTYDIFQPFKLKAGKSFRSNLTTSSAAFKR